MQTWFWQVWPLEQPALELHRMEQVPLTHTWPGPQSEETAQLPVPVLPEEPVVEVVETAPVVELAPVVEPVPVVEPAALVPSAVELAVVVLAVEPAAVVEPAEVDEVLEVVPPVLAEELLAPADPVVVPIEPLMVAVPWVAVVAVVPPAVLAGEHCWVIGSHTSQMLLVQTSPCPQSESTRQETVPWLPLLPP